MYLPTYDTFIFSKIICLTSDTKNILSIMIVLYYVRKNNLKKTYEILLVVFNKIKWFDLKLFEFLKEYILKNCFF